MSNTEIVFRGRVAKPMRVGDCREGDWVEIVASVGAYLIVEELEGKCGAMCYAHGNNGVPKVVSNGEIVKTRFDATITLTPCEGEG